MIAVIFEVFPADGLKGDYLERAARLKSELECMDGFISVERFQSLTEPDKLLSLSFWRDEDAVASWRSRAGHRASQSAGRKGIFHDYRLRVAAVVRDYGMLERREQAPPDSRAIYNVSVEHSGEATEDTAL
jgi:heme-degrading monooxygenase HmoA